MNMVVMMMMMMCMLLFCDIKIVRSIEGAMVVN